MVTVFALAAALLYGGADFLGGAAAKGAHVLSVVTISAGAGLAVIALGAVIFGGPPRAAGAGWGIAAGAAGAIGLVILYAGLAAGPMSVVSPVSALTATVLPVGVALADGERPGAPVYAGALLCLIAIVAVSSGGAPQRRGLAGADREPAGRRLARPRSSWPDAGRALGYGMGSGVSFGLFFLFLREAGQSGQLWPVLAARVSGLLVILAVAAAVRPGPVRGTGSRVPGRRVLLAALGSGAGDAGANLCYVAATRAGLFGLAVVLTALYPGVTVLLARVLLGERLRWVQRVGLIIAALGIGLVSA
jgi:drug/metabolite transporter (DMT)-like permease